METENTSVEETSIDDPKAVLAALERAKSDAKRFREEKEQLEIDLNSKDQKIAEFSGRLLREKVAQQLSAEGLKDAKRFLKYIDFNSLEFDAELELVGFQDQYAKLKQDFPEIFDPKLRVGGQADGAVSTAINTRVSATELQARKILGKL